jgi:NACHT N-terminal Helical domain 1
VVGLEPTALSLAKTIVQKAAAAWIADRRTAEERKKELSALLTSKFRHAAPEQRFLDEATSELESLGHEFRGLDDGERAAALQAVRNTFERADLTDRALFAVDVDPAKLARRLRAGQPQAKTDAWLGEVGSAFYDAALDRSCKLYVRAVEQVPAFVGRSLAEMLNRLSDLPGQVAARVVDALGEAQAAVADPDGGVTVAGQPLEEVADPFALEVHRPVQPEDAPPELPILPAYIAREHDQNRRAGRRVFHGQDPGLLGGPGAVGPVPQCTAASR